VLKVFFGREVRNGRSIATVLLEVTGGTQMAGVRSRVDLSHHAAFARQIEVDPSHPYAIRTVRGVGYMFVPPKDWSAQFYLAQGAGP